MLCWAVLRIESSFVLENIRIQTQLRMWQCDFMCDAITRICSSYCVPNATFLAEFCRSFCAYGLYIVKEAREVRFARLSFKNSCYNVFHVCFTSWLPPQVLPKSTWSMYSQRYAINIATIPYHEYCVFCILCCLECLLAVRCLPTLLSKEFERLPKFPLFANS